MRIMKLVRMMKTGGLEFGDMGQPPETAQVSCDDGNRSDTQEKEPLGQGNRRREPSVRPQDYVNCSHHAEKEYIYSFMPTTAYSTYCFPITHYVNCAIFSARHRQFLTAITAEREFVTF